MEYSYIHCTQNTRSVSTETGASCDYFNISRGLAKTLRPLLIESHDAPLSSKTLMNKYNLDRALAFIKRTMEFDHPSGAPSGDSAENVVANEDIDSASGVDIIPPSPNQSQRSESMAPAPELEENKEEEEEDWFGEEEPNEPAKEPNDCERQVVAADDVTVQEGTNANPKIDLRAYLYPPHNSPKADELFKFPEEIRCDKSSCLDYWYPEQEKPQYPLILEFDSLGTTIWYQSKGNLNRAMYMLVHFLFNITDAVSEHLYNFDRTDNYHEIETALRVAGRNFKYRNFKNEVVKFHMQWSQVLRYILSSIGFDWFEGYNESITMAKSDMYYREALHKHDCMLKINHRFLVDYFQLEEAKLVANHDDIVATQYGQSLINKDLQQALAVLLKMRDNTLINNYGLDDSYKVDGHKMDQVFWQLVHSEFFLKQGYDILINLRPDLGGWPERVLNTDSDSFRLTPKKTGRAVFGDITTPAEEDKVGKRYTFANRFPNTPELLFPDNIINDCERFYKNVTNNVGIEQNILCKQLEHGATIGEVYKGPTDLWGKNKHFQKMTPKSYYHSLFYPTCASLDVCIKVSENRMEMPKGSKLTPKIYEATNMLSWKQKEGEEWYKKRLAHMPKWYRCHLCNYTIKIDRDVRVFQPPAEKNPKKKWDPIKTGNDKQLNWIDWGVHAKRDDKYPGYQFLGERGSPLNEGLAQHRVAVFHPFVDVPKTGTSPYQSRFSVCNTVADKALREMKNHYKQCHHGDLGCHANRYFFGQSKYHEKQGDSKRKANKATQYTDLFAAVADGIDLGLHDFSEWDYWQKKESNADKNKKPKKRK